jgi:hypothetical protein
VVKDSFIGVSFVFLVFKETKTTQLKRNEKLPKYFYLANNHCGLTIAA